MCSEIEEQTANFSATGVGRCN